MKELPLVVIDKDLCIKCGLCRDDCVSHVITISESGAEVMAPGCIQCGHCVAICPKHAITLPGITDEPEPVAQDWQVDAVQLMHQIKARRSMRQFTDQKISRDEIMQIIEAGRYTPTGSNKQGVSYTVLTEHLDEYEALALSSMRKGSKLLGIFSPRYRHITLDAHFLFKKAPAVIVIKANSLVDGALAASTMELMAQSMGLGVLYSGFFTVAARYSGKLKKKLALSSGEKIVTTLVVGYPAVRYQRTAPRKMPAVLFD